MRSNRVFLGVESLEARNAPSTLSPVSAIVSWVHSDHDHDDHHLLGNGYGHYRTDEVESGAGKDFHITAAVHLDDRGEFLVTGQLHSVGFVVEGKATGRLTFTDARGSFTIELTGPEQHGFSALPTTFQYHVVSGTGAFANLKASGELDITRHADPGHLTGSLQFHFEKH